MNWYFFIKLADIDSALQRANASPDVIDFISNITNNILKGLASRIVFSTKGQISLQELKNKLNIKKEKILYSPNNQELQILNNYKNNKDFYNWLKIQIINSKGSLDLSRVSHIWDWYEKTNQNLSGFNYKQALNAADKWSQTEQSKASTEYQPLQQKDIFMTFPDGMKFVKLSNKHDTATEGNLMDHCVGNYCEDVAEEKIYVYSLRTPNNEPVATLGFDKDYLFAKQIKGKNDVNPVEWKNHIISLLQKLGIKYYDSSSESNGNDYELVDSNDIDLNNPENKLIKDWIFKKLANNNDLPDFAFIHFENLIFKKDPEIMKYLTINSELAYFYALDIFGGRFPEGEEAIAKSAEYSYGYASNVLEGKRFPLGEEAMAKDSRYSYRYARNILKGRFTKGEKAIARNAEYSYYYVFSILKRRFPEGEEAIAKDRIYSLYYAEFLQNNNIEVPEIFKQYPLLTGLD